MWSLPPFPAHLLPPPSSSPSRCWLARAAEALTCLRRSTRAQKKKKKKIGPFKRHNCTLVLCRPNSPTTTNTVAPTTDWDAAMHSQYVHMCLFFFFFTLLMCMNESQRVHHALCCTPFHPSSCATQTPGRDYAPLPLDRNKHRLIREAHTCKHKYTHTQETTTTTVAQNIFLIDDFFFMF